jgi:hypothetical protein
MADEPEKLVSIPHFLLNTPLYARYKINDDLKDLYILYGSANGTKDNKVATKIDGYCPTCKKDTTFTLVPQDTTALKDTTFARVPQNTTALGVWNNLKARNSHDSCTLICARSSGHHIRFYYYINNLIIQKIGQYPSLATIAIDENRTKYRGVLKGDNWNELYKAVGLAAHGEGIGSFVYLRRVFERLIYSRFEDHRDAEGWNEKDFLSMRMDDRIGHLKKYLPEFLVENRRLYSIFSIGIHEMDNENCLNFFEIGRDSITFILDDDLKQKQERENRARLSKAVATFISP